MEESKRIKVHLNGEPVVVFRGMKVKHILTIEMLKEVRKGNKIITDEEGHKRGLEGSLSDGERFFLKNNKNA